jgi:hypothetical protein
MDAKVFLFPSSQLFPRRVGLWKMEINKLIGSEWGLLGQVGEGESGSELSRKFLGGRFGKCRNKYSAQTHLSLGIISQS